MSRSAPRHAAPKHARTGWRLAPTASSVPRTVDLGEVRHHAAVPIRSRGRLSRAAGIAAVTAAVVAVSGGGYVLSQASTATVVAGGVVNADAAVVVVTPSSTPSPTATATATAEAGPTAAVTAAQPASPSPTPSLSAMRGAGTVALTPDTLAARQQAVDDAAAAAAKKAQEAKDATARAAAAARSSRSSDRQAEPGGSPKAIARAMLANYGWGDDQFSCLVTMWNHESGWNPHAENAGSGAYGIPQALPGPKMATAGSDWQSDPATQISWGLNYIKTRYNTPCGAWSFWQRGSWY